jgi:hypothetical protein
VGIFPVQDACSLFSVACLFPGFVAKCGGFAGAGHQAAASRAGDVLLVIAHAALASGRYGAGCFHPIDVLQSTIIDVWTTKV